MFAILYGIQCGCVSRVRECCQGYCCIDGGWRDRIRTDKFHFTSEEGTFAHYYGKIFAIFVQQMKFFFFCIGMKRKSSTGRVSKKMKYSAGRRRKAKPKYSKSKTSTSKSAGSFGLSKDKMLKAPGRKHTFKAAALALVPQQVKVYDGQSSTVTVQGSQVFNNIADCMDGGRLRTFVADSTAYEKHVWIEGISATTTLWNMTTEIIARVTIYDWECKEDVPNGLTVEAAITNGLAAKYNTTNPQNVVYMEPTESLEFTRFFRVTKRTEVVLAPNENHVHKHTTVLNKLYTNIYNTNISDPNYLKGLSSGVLIRTIGGCVGGSSTGSGTHSLTYGAVRVGYVTQWKDFVKFPQGSATNQVVASVGTLALADIGAPLVPVSFTDATSAPVAV